MNEKIAADVCEVEFKRLCVARRIECDETAMTVNERESFSESKAKLLRMMSRGELVITPAPENNAVFTPPGGKPITFYKATGATLMAQDGFGPHDNVGRVTAVATEMTKSIPGELSKLDLEDFRAVTAITNFFFTR